MSKYEEQLISNDSLEKLIFKMTFDIPDLVPEKPMELVFVFN